MQNPEDPHPLLIKVIKWSLDICEVVGLDNLLIECMLEDSLRCILLLMTEGLSEETWFLRWDGLVQYFVQIPTLFV